jgi:prepilin peptidase CpaA
MYQAVSVLLLLAFAVYFDVRWRRIPNALTATAIIAGIVGNALSFGTTGVLLSIAGFLVGGLLLLAPVALRWWGAGDLKLFAALGAIGGPAFILWAGLYSFVAGGLMALAVLLLRRQTAPVLAGIAVDLYTRQAPRAESGIRLPYAVPIAVGTLIALVVP